ncbi:ABC transporter ATP-binding protein [Facklamia hominis]
MKELMIYFKGYGWISFLAPLCKLIEALLELAVPLIVARLVDQVMQQAPYQKLLIQGGWMLALAFLGLAFSMMGQYFSAKAATGFANNLGRDLYQYALAMDQSSYDRLGRTSINNRLSSDLYQILTGLNTFFRLLLRSPFIVFGSMFMAALIDWRMTLYFVVMVIILFLIVGGITYFGQAYYQKIQAALDQLSVQVSQQMKGLRVIRAFNQESKEQADFKAANSYLTQLQLQAGKLTALTNPLTYLVVNSTLIVILLQGGRFIDRGHLSPGQLVALVNYLLAILVELVKLTKVVLVFNRTQTAAHRIVAVLEAPLEDKKFMPGTGLQEGQLLACRQLSFAYPDTGGLALCELNFSVNVGDFIGIMGATGSGKTTLIRLLTQFYQPTQGQIAYSPAYFDLATKDTLRQGMAVVLQTARLFKGTVRSNLLLADPQADDQELWQALETAQAKDFVADLDQGLDSPILAQGMNLSGGQRQRLVIARAILAKAPLLILDAATSALDYLTEAKLLQALRKGSPSQTIILISERPDSLKAADKILLLDQGKQLAFANHHDLLASQAIYQEIYQLQKGGGKKDEE